ncbi:hypothetical protein ABZT47_28930 [Sphaerisporangium sp. NPDC005289]|uniref:hypothetical protein n=1 Tax=Sphaerisporangium sp. NPDC005289 TaxID=3155247 RepID=UPI0033AB437C
MFNFDERLPVARIPVKGYELGNVSGIKPGPLFFQEKRLDVKNGKEEALYIQSRITRDAVTFDIRIDYRIGAESKTLTIGDHGRQFALTAINCTEKGRYKGSAIIAPGYASYDTVWYWDLRGGGMGQIKQARRPQRFENYSACVYHFPRSRK